VEFAGRGRLLASPAAFVDPTACADPRTLRSLSAAGGEGYGKQRVRADRRRLDLLEASFPCGPGRPPKSIPLCDDPVRA